MESATQTFRSLDFQETKYSKEASSRTLYSELIKGIESKNNGDVHTIEEAWEEIDRI